jgi:predicted nucleotidyltransferase
MTDILEQKKAALVKLCEKYHVKALDVFGSAATSDFDDSKSDMDFLVEFDNTVKSNRFDTFFCLLDELKELFGRPVDLVEPGGLRNPYFIESVNKTRRRIYAAA